MATPIPKPRTKFGVIEPTGGDGTKELNGIDGHLEEQKKYKPPVPPRPPTKPPRSHIAENIDLNINNENGRNSGSLSPPSRMAPAPPPRPPPPGWKPDIVQSISPPPDLPPPPLPFSSEVCEIDCITNPIYFGLEEFRKLADIAEEKEDCIKQGKERTITPENVKSVDNVYTPAPISGNFTDSSNFFESNERLSAQQNLYLSHDELLSMSGSNDYQDVVESCGSTSRNSDHRYEVLPDSMEESFSKDVDRSSKDEMLKEGSPQIDGSTVTFLGFVTLTSVRREKRVHCRLRNMQLSFHEDDETSEVAFGPYSVYDFLMFRLYHQKKDHHGFSDSASTSSSTSPADSIAILISEKKHAITFRPDEAASIWMFMLSEAWLSLASGLTCALRNSKELCICGLVWVRQGSTGEWKEAAAGISDDGLSYVLLDMKERVIRRSLHCSDNLITIDLRKVVSLREKADKADWCPSIKHKRGPFLISLTGITFYFDAKDEYQTNHWYECIDEILKKPSTTLESSRLTADDVPVIVDKCIRFVSAYGLKTDGIYRRNGKVSEAKTILTRLSEDPVGYHIIQENDETVYAVADVLRQYLRKLDEPLISTSIQPLLFELAKQPPSDELFEEYAKVIAQLAKVNRATLKKLVSHLKSVNEKSDENRASVENLAKIFGASLFSTERQVEKVFSETYNDQINAMIHLMMGYDTIFHITTEEELSRQILKDIERRKNPIKQGAAFYIAVHMWEKENLPFNVNIDMASEEVCREAIAKRGFDAPLNDSYSVFEVICTGQLIRRLPASEKLSKSVFRWIDWNCKDGYILFDHENHRFDGHDTSPFIGRVKMAEPGSKTFKTYEMKIENGVSISVFRNEKLWKTWKLDETIWFVGGENARKSPNQFNTTMLAVDKSAYSTKLPGYCMSFKEETERRRWLNAVHYAQTGGMPESLVFI